MNAYVSPWMDEELAMYRDAVRKFVAAEFVPHEERWRKQQHVDRDAWCKAGERGLLLTDIPREYGGAGGSFAHEAVIYEELVRAGIASFGNAVHSIVAHYILNH